MRSSYIRAFFLFLVLLALPCHSLSYGDAYANRGKSYGRDLNLDQVIAAFQNPSAPRSVEEFLAWVQIKAPDHLRHFTLMHSSESLQGASYQDPRAIVFGPSARLIFTFNGNHKQKGFYNLEFIQFREGGNGHQPHFEFRELSFDREGKNPAKLSAANPPRCMQCHTTALTPIWREYEIWDGAYGKFDDAIIDFKIEKYARASIEVDTNRFNEMQVEFDQFKLFQRRVATHSRYSKLAFPEGSPVSPYSPTIRGEYTFRPNLALTMRLAAFNAKRIAAQIRMKGEGYQRLKVPLLALLMDCGSMGKPGEEWARFKGELAQLLRSQSRDDPGRFETHAQVADHNVQAWLLQYLGVEKNDWTLDRKKNVWSYFEGLLRLRRLVASELIADLPEELRQEDPIPTRAVSYDEEPGYDIENPRKSVCEKLIDESLLGESSYHEMILQRKNLIPITPLGSKTIQMCLACHGKNSHQESGAPAIPLLETKAINREALERWSMKISEHALSDSADMPPLRKLGPRERAELKNFLQMISSKN